MRRRPFLAALLPFARAGAETPSASQARASLPSDPAAVPGRNGSPPARGVTHRPLQFPADHGAHTDTRIEWWYVTGWLRPADAAEGPGNVPRFGFQVTFFRTRTGLGEDSPSQFAARQLVIAHVALTDLGAAPGAGLAHEQRIAREGFGLAGTPAAAGVQEARLGDWMLRRAAALAGAPTALAIEARTGAFALELALAGTQPLLLQGDSGYSRKGPRPGQASRYYSEPQLAVSGRVRAADGRAAAVAGRAWLDHEWSDELLPDEATGWDWVGFNLHDGSALTAFRLRRPDGRPLWAGGSLRDAAGRLRIFGPDEVAFTPLRRWQSPRTRIEYPVEFALETPAGRWRIAALRDDQELDGRQSSGSLYWEGLAALNSAQGPSAGWGYLELTGYGERLKL